jgi:toxin ParE1/3/4
LRLQYTKSALRQIDEALSFIKTRSPQGAAHVRERLDGVMAMLMDHPFAGQETNRRGVRRVALTPYPYVIFYRVDDEEVVVMRLRHAARRPIFEMKQRR